MTFTFQFQPDESRRKTSFLDLACGDGFLGVNLKWKDYSGALTGIDISNGMLKHAEKTGCYSKLIKADLLQNIPLDDESFDYLTCIGASGAFLSKFNFRSLSLLNSKIIVLIYVRTFMH